MDSNQFIHTRMDYFDNKKITCRILELVEENCWSYKTTFSNFVSKLDLGIICYSPSMWVMDSEYSIIDEKKWLLSKIKYGF